MENHEQKPTPEPRKSVSIDGVLNELRSVLSGLGEPTPPKNDIPVENPSPSPVPPPTPFMKTPVAPPPEPPISKKIVEPTPAPRNDVSSDADFWNGNVLGWPSSTPEMNAPPPATPPPASYEKPALEGEPFSLDTPFLKQQQEDLPVMPPVASPPPVHESVFEPNPWGVSPIIPDPPQPPTARPMAPPVDEPFVDPFAVVPPEDIATVKKSAPPQASMAGPIAPLAPPPMEFEAALPASEPPSQKLPIPIPGTLTDPLKRESPKVKSDDPLNLKGTDMKPAGLVQIACLFPEGQERQGQQFVNKLKELGEKSKTRLRIEPVFVSSWKEGNADMSAWSKSATLSGADIMFILSFKKDVAQFKVGPSSLEKSVRTRVIAIEQLTLRTLYADILIELERGK